MKVIAQRGEQFLLDLGDGQGQIFDRRRGKRFPPRSIDSIMARGYWNAPQETAVTAALLELGDLPGHDFRGNQWTGGRGGGDDRELGRRTSYTPSEPREALRDIPLNIGPTYTDRDNPTSAAISGIRDQLPASASEWFRAPGADPNVRAAEMKAALTADLNKLARETDPPMSAEELGRRAQLISDFVDWRVASNLGLPLPGIDAPSKTMPDTISGRFNDRFPEHDDLRGSLTNEMMARANDELRDLHRGGNYDPIIAAQHEALVREAGGVIQGRVEEILQARYRDVLPTTEQLHDAELQLAAARLDSRTVSQSVQDLNDEIRRVDPNSLERVRLQAELADARAAFARVGVAHTAAARQVREYEETIALATREATLSALSEVREFGGQINTAHASDKNAAPMQEVSRFFPTDWISRSNEYNAIDVRAQSQRGYYSHDGQTKFGGSDLRYNVSPSTFGERNLPTIAHEYGHRMEYTIDGVTEAEHAFLTRRAGDGASLESLRSTGYGYRRDERSYPDEFVSAYIGKVYGDGGPTSSKEVLSMGMDYLVGKGVNSDPDHAAFVLGLLAMLPGEKN